MFAAATELHGSNLDKLEIALAADEASPTSLENLNDNILQREQRECLAHVSNLWRAMPEITANELLGALRAARFSDQHSARAEICWSGPVSSAQGFRTTVEAFRELISSARRSVLLVSFAVGEVEHLRSSLEATLEQGVSLRMILEDFNVFSQETRRPRFAAFGRQVLDRAAIYVWPLAKRRMFEGRIFGSMHVKCLVIDDTALRLTSANWSEAAMGDNMELGLLVRDPEMTHSVISHFEHLIASGVLTLLPAST
jgi:phosphatidylserine/phosphatidylglycerophosphate/cardiolipin synthase-like enzyme